MSLRCPQCDTPVPAAKVFWFVRMVVFDCTNCRARLALSGDTRAMLVASVAAAIVISYVVKGLTVSETPAIITFFAGLVIGCGLAWRCGALRIVEENREDAVR